MKADPSLPQEIIDAVEKYGGFRAILSRLAELDRLQALMAAAPVGYVPIYSLPQLQRADVYFNDPYVKASLLNGQRVRLVIEPATPSDGGREP